MVSRRHMARRDGVAVVAMLLLALVSNSRADLSVFRDDSGQLLVCEGEKPVLRYNARTVPVPAGIDGIYAVARSGYIHPLHGLDGAILTTDYSKDHPHHRGIYWAWPEVTYQGEKHDVHALQGVFSRPEGVPVYEADARSADITATNRWLWEDQTPIVRETVHIRVHAATADMRIIDLAFTYTALESGVTVARRGRAAYGGLNIRLSARRDQRIVTHIGEPRFPAAPSWGEVVGIPPGSEDPVGVLILQHPGNVAYPEDWVQYPLLNWLQPAFPSRHTAYELLPGEPLSLSYRIVIRRGSALNIPYADLWHEYAREWQPFARLKAYAFGSDTAYLRKWERLLESCSPTERAKAEPALLDLLASAASRTELKAWICAQLKLTGSALAVPALLKCLADPDLCTPACQALESIPGNAADVALGAAFGRLPPHTRGAVLAVLGTRGRSISLSLIAASARQGDAESSVPAIRALGVMGSTEALQVLLRLSGSAGPDAVVRDAALRSMRTLLRQGEPLPPEVDVFLRDLLAPGHAPHHRAAALGILGTVDPQGAVAIAVQWLQNGPVRLQRASVAALGSIPDEMVLPVLLPRLGALPAPARAIALEELARRPRASVHDALVACLGDPVCAASAARALGRTGTAVDVPVLGQLGLDRSPAGAAAREALLTLEGEAVDSAVRVLLQSAAGTMRRLGADLLTARLGPASLPDMLRLIADPERKVSRKVFAAIGDHGGRATGATVISEILTLPAPNRTDAYQALAAIGRRTGDPAAILRPLLQATRADGSTYRDVVATLHAFPCDLSAALLGEVVGGTDANLVGAAGRALLKWPSPPPAMLLAAVKDAAARPEEGDLKTVLEKASEHLSILALVNLCKGMKVVSSHPWQGRWAPKMAVDGNIALNSYWSCEHSPSSITVELGAVMPLRAVRVVNYWGGGRYYQYTVAVSVDGKAWIGVADMSRNTTPAAESGTLHTFERAEARYVRVTMLHNSANPGMHIVELEAFSTVPGKE